MGDSILVQIPSLDISLPKFPDWISHELQEFHSECCRKNYFSLNLAVDMDKSKRVLSSIDKSNKEAISNLEDHVLYLERKNEINRTLSTVMHRFVFSNHMRDVWEKINTLKILDSVDIDYGSNDPQVIFYQICLWCYREIGGHTASKTSLKSKKKFSAWEKEVGLRAEQLAALVKGSYLDSILALLMREQFERHPQTKDMDIDESYLRVSLSDFLLSVAKHKEQGVEVLKQQHHTRVSQPGNSNSHQRAFVLNFVRAMEENYGNQHKRDIVYKVALELFPDGADQRTLDRWCAKKSDSVPRKTEKLLASQNF